MRLTQLAAALVWTFGVLAAIPALAPQDADSCPSLNKCRKSEAKERKECPKCEKAKIKADEALCATCARKEESCRICGLPKAGSGGPRSFEAAYQKGVESITAADMREFLTKFASDEMEGRDTGSEGIRKARAFLIDHLKKAGAKPLKGDSFELPWNNCANVGAVYPGIDPQLKNEYVIVGSHMDHIGKQGAIVNNGADDNGSGSTTNKEICEALNLSRIPLKRSVINLWFTGEEKGLLGSRGYTQNPAVPHEQCVAMLNIDMVGRNPQKAADLFGVGSSPQFSAVVDSAAAKYPRANVNKVMGKGAYFHRSDQANFWNAGIPVMFMFTGEHADYHKPTDTPDKINFDRMQEIGRFVFHMMVELANSPTRPAKDPNYK
jgi:hypothetical protein